MLEKYVKDFPNLYGPASVSYNVHSLIHLGADVTKYGNLDNYSAFKFENFMQKLKKLIKKNNQPLQQLNNRLYEIDEHVTADEKSMPYATVEYNLGGFLYRDLLYADRKYSVKPPNNYCLLEGKIFKITAIVEQNLEIFVKGHFICNTKEFFDKPFSSYNLNICCTSTTSEILEHELKTFSIKYISSKIMALTTYENTVYLPLL